MLLALTDVLISAGIASFLGLCAVILLALPLNAYSWRQIPFMGAFVEQTLVFNDIGPQGDTAWSGHAAGLRYPHQLVALDSAPVRSTTELLAALRAHRPGQLVNITYLDAGGREFNTRVALQSFPSQDFVAFFVVPYLVGLAYLVFGIAVYYSRYDNATGRAFALFCGGIALVTAGLFDLYTTHLFSWAWTLALPTVAASAATIGLLFPEPFRIGRRIRQLNWMFFAPAIALVAVGEIVLYDMRRPTAYARVWQATYLLAAVSALFLIASLAFRSWRSSTPIAREQARLVLFGAALAFGPVLFFLISGAFYHTSVPFDVAVCFPPFAFFPIATTYAILQYRTLKASYVVARAVLYLALAATATGAYLGMLRVLELLAGADLHADNPYLVGVSILAVFTLLRPVGGRIEAWVDSLFFFGTTLHRAHLEQLTRDLTTSVGLDEVLNAMLRHVVAVLQPSSCAVYTLDANAGVYRNYEAAQHDRHADELAPDSALPTFMRRSNEVVYLPPAGAIPDAIESETERLAAMDASLLFAIPSRDELFAWAMLAARRSGRPYTVRDVHFLENVRDQAGLAVDRALLFEELRRSEAQFRAVVDTTAAAIFIDQDTWVRFANQEMEQLTGYDASELTEMRFWDLVHPDLQDMVRERGLARQRGEDVPSRYEVCIVRKDGQERWLDVSLGAFELEGKPAVIGAAIDITVRKRAEEAEQVAQRRSSIIQAANIELTRSLDPDAVINTLLDYLHKLVDYDCACVYLEDDAGELHVAVMRGFENWTDVEGARAALNDGIIEFPEFHTVLTARRSVLIEDSSQHSNWIHKDALAFMRTSLLVPIVARDEVIGIYGLANATPGSITREHEQLAKSLAAPAAAAIQNAWLYEQVQTANTRLRDLSQQLATTQDSERRRIARELHDEAGQTLTALKVELDLLRSDIPARHRRQRERVAKAVSIVDQAAKHVRMLAHDLRPPVLDTLGLSRALENLCRDFGASTRVDVRFEADKLPPLNDAQSLCIYRVAQEALTNVARHADAYHVWVRLAAEDGYVTLEVEDDGCGIEDPASILVDGNGDGIGLRGMRDRLELLGGELRVESEAGCGTDIRAHLELGKGEG